MKSIEIIRPYIRNGAFPIDSLSLFTSYSDALDYTYNSPSAYATQIIGVDDKDKRKTAIYKINYDPNKIHNYVLERIEVGNGSTLFNFKGSVPTFNNLPKEDVRTGELWLVEDENKFYISFVDSEKITWKEITVNIQKVSKSNDGILSKEVYSTFFNENNSDAVYFSKKSKDVSATPENNRWLNISHTSKENILEYSIPSIGLVKEIISGIIEQTVPFIEIYSETPDDNIIGSQIMPTLSIIYHKEFGGNPLTAKIIRHINKSTDGNNHDKHLVFDGIPNFVRVLNENTELYKWEWSDNENCSAKANDSVDYEVIINYDDAIDSNLSAGSCTSTKQFFFYKIINYGHNLKTYNPIYMKKNNIIDLKYDPSSPEFKDKIINSIFIEIPVEATLESVEYVPQFDKYAISLFKETLNDGNIKRYEYKLFGNMQFKSPGEFIFRVIL